jgi:ATP-binding cassette subfamily F protein 3
MEHDQWKRELDRMTARWEALSGELEEIRQKLAVPS